jgi:hypothetical protein
MALECSAEQCSTGAAPQTFLVIEFEKKKAI